MKQLSIICKEASTVTAVTALLGENGIDIRDLTFQQLGESAILNVVADQPDQCLRLLTDNGFTVLADETLLLKLEDRPGMLAQVARTISDMNVDIRSLTLVNTSQDGNVVAVSTTDNSRVREAYIDNIIN